MGVCEVFADLNIPRAYFKRHWTSDPPALRRLSGVLVAVQRSTGRMVATVRIFRRVIRVRGKAVTVGGLFATQLPCAAPVTTLCCPCDHPVMLLTLTL